MPGINKMSNIKMITFEHRRGFYKKEEFGVWMRKLIDMYLANRIDKSAVINNAPVHNSPKQILRENKEVKIVCLGPYSLFLNSIELLKSYFKLSAKRKLRDRMNEVLTY